MKKDLCNSFLKEGEILGQLDHPNIVKFVKVMETETRFFLVMELIECGSLKAFMEERFKEGKPFSDEEAATIMKAIFSAVKYIHSKNIVHRDIKPGNVYLNK
jgi:serine/threonine protein kinase